MSLVSNMVIPAKAVSRLFGACANASEGADSPSLFDFGANFTIRAGSKYLNWVARAENNGSLSGLPGGAEARNKERQEEYERYIVQLWLSRMSEEYQRSYRELMTTLNEADEFCDSARKEIARRVEWADHELDRLHDQIVVIDGEECFIRNGVIVGRDGMPSRLSKDKQDEAWRFYANDQKRKAEAERGGKVIDFREKNTELGAEVEEHAQRAKKTRQLAETRGMVKEEMDPANRDMKKRTEELQLRIKEMNDDLLTGLEISQNEVRLEENPALGVDLDNEGLTAQFENKASGHSRPISQPDVSALPDKQWASNQTLSTYNNLHSYKS